MTIKNKQPAENNKPAVEPWRKPLQVPRRANVMRSFYQGAEDDSNQTVKQEKQAATISKEEVVSPIRIEQKTGSQLSPNKASRGKIKEKPLIERSSVAPRINETVTQTRETATNKLTKADLSQKLGIEIDDLFDVHELLRGKSFDIYRALMESCDDKGRCKITQPELMKRTGIKNRRTFYKHEDWLIGLRLLEKRHLPGDHKGVVYRVLELSEVLPFSNEMLDQFKNRLKNIEYSRKTNNPKLQGFRHN